MTEDEVRRIAREELAAERVGAAGTTPIGTVTMEFTELMVRHKLTFREATMIFRDARAKVWPTLEERN